MELALCVDSLGLQLGGIGRYTWELCKGLAGRDEVTSLHYIGHRRLIEDPALLLQGKKLPRRRRIFRPLHDWKLRQVLRSSLVHGPNYFLPPKAHDGIITVHDLSVFRFPETHPPARVQAFERLFSSSIARAGHIITDSETVRQEIIDSFAVSPDSVTAIHLGVDDRFRRSDDAFVAKTVRNWRLTPGEYGLCVSTLEPRKKISELLSAWRDLPSALRSKFPLVLAGGSGWKNEFIHDQIQAGVAEGWLWHLGFVDETLLPALYSGAALFIYPSSYEGFGLPPIEAMAAGIPVIVANQSCLPEVCGNAARYIDPDDHEGLVSAIRDSLLDPVWRTESIRRGLEQARQYSWNRCVDDTLSVYRQFINTR